MLLKRVPSDTCSVTLLANWETGYTAEVRNTLIVAQRGDSSVIKSVLGPGPVLYTQTMLHQTLEMCAFEIGSIQPMKSSQQPVTSKADHTNSHLAATSAAEIQKVQSLKSVSFSGEG